MVLAFHTADQLSKARCDVGLALGLHPAQPAACSDNVSQGYRFAELQLNEARCDAGLALGSG